MNHSDDSAPPASPPRSRRKWVWLGCIVLLIIVMIGSCWTYLHSVAEKGWQAAVAEAEQDDPNWRWEEMQARRRTWEDDKNGALVMRAAKALLPREWPAWDVPFTGASPERDGAPEGEERPPANATDPEQERLALQQSFGRLEPQFQLDERQLAALRTELMKAVEAVTEARRMVNFPSGRFPIQYAADYFSTLMPDIGDARTIANLLDYDVLLRTQKQDFAGAMTSSHALLHLCRYFDAEPTVIAMLVRVAIRSVALRRLERILAQGEPEPAGLARLQKVLEEEAAVPVLLQTLRGERAGGDRMIQALETGQVSWAQVGAAGGGLPGTPLEALRMLMPGGIRGQRTALLRLNNRVIELAKLLPDQRQVEEANLTRELETLPVLARLLSLAHQKTINVALRTQAELRCALVMLAAERYRRTHQRWPDNLAALVPDFLAQVPEDPFDGKPLRFRRAEDGWVIYSVSLDLTDDGGKLSNRQEKGTDLGFRLWDVKQRRQPAKPRPPVAAPGSAP